MNIQLKKGTFTVSIIGMTENKLPNDPTQPPPKFYTPLQKKRFIKEHPPAKNGNWTYKIEVLHNGGRITFDFTNSIDAWRKKEHFSDNGLPFALYCLILDAQAGEMGIDDFCSEFFYPCEGQKISEVLAIHTSCQDYTLALSQIGINSDDLCDIATELQENFDC